MSDRAPNPGEPNYHVFFYDSYNTACLLFRVYPHYNDDMCRSLLLNATLPKSYKAGCHLMLTETSSSPLLHASKAVELFRELLIEEPEDEDALENLWGARRVLEELLENGRVTFWTVLMDEDVKQKELAQVKKETLPKKVRRSARISALESARAAAVASGSGGL